MAIFKDEYDRLSQNLIYELTQIENNEKVNVETKLNVDKFTALLKTLTALFATNKELLNSKFKEPSRSIELASTKEQLDSINELILGANAEVRKNNSIVSNYREEKLKLINQIWRYIVEEVRFDIEAYEKNISDINKSIEGQEHSLQSQLDSYKALNIEIKKLSKNVTSIEPTVIEINNALEKFGFLNFEIVPSKTELGCYQLQREDGELAESTLSEGEITFITFLYFLQLAKGSTDEETITEDRVLIVDDPISSLDSNILFIVSSLLKGIIRNIKSENCTIKQIILLTHNVYFHKEVSFIDGRTKENKETEYWILRKNNKITSIQSFGMKNPIKTSYELLWQEIRNREHNSYVTIQNTMRRIIENYFKILGNYGDDKLIQNFHKKEEQEICRSLICWINDGSHSISDDLYIETPQDTVDKYLQVFKQIFILTNHAGHYEMMMGEGGDD